MQYPYTWFFNLANWMQMSHDGGMVTVHHIFHFSSTLTWINVFKWSSTNTEGLPEPGVSIISKQSSLKQENNFLAMLSLQWHCLHTWHKCFWPPTLLLPLYWTQREEYVGNVPISPLSTPFLASQFHSLSSNDKTSICKLKHNNIELQIKNDYR